MTINCSYYDILINDWAGLRTFIKNGDYSQLLVIVDENTKTKCLPIFQEKIGGHFYIIETSSGEQHKTLDTCTQIWKQMIEAGADRHSLCINLGGGVIGDMGGFAAATFMRGMDFIQVPTSLLSQVDASVGGKLGIDFVNFKNLIGIIQPPSGVFIFTDFLTTLPERHLRSGYAELLKHGLIADVDIFESLCEPANISNIDTWPYLVTASVKVKKNITEEDPKEKGVRKILNFGHTIGHAIETINLATEDPLLHGESIAIGMVCEAHLSYQLGDITKEECDEIKGIMIKYYDHHPTRVASVDTLIPIMSKDKKNKGGKIRFSLLERVGKGNFDIEVSTEMIANSLAYYKL